MKKLILFIFTFYIGISTCLAYSIPKNAIRFRVISNSNSEHDLMVKYEVSNRVIAYLSRKKCNYRCLKKEKGNINLIVRETLREYGIDDYSVNVGYNFFPKKVYKGELYKEGRYRSLVIRIGSGKGHNFWCVLYPNLCLEKDVHYKSILKDILDKYFA